MSRLQPATERGLFPGSLLISLGMHAALAAMLLFWGGLPKPPPLAVLTVSLVAPDASLPGPGGPTASMAKPSPPPPISPPKPEKHKATSVSRPQPEKDLPPKQPAPPSVAPTSAPPTPAAPRPASPPPLANSPGSPLGGLERTAGAGQAQAGSGSAGSVGLSSGPDGKGGDGNSATTQRHYLNLVRARILAKRQYPYLARERRQEGLVRLRFTLSPAGTLAQGVQVVQPSGFGLLDEQARQCVLTAAPFPPFPLDLKRDRLTVELPIIYKLSEVGM